MKRPNPETGLPFAYGDVREDGYIFWSYGKHVTKTGFRSERWMSPEKFEETKIKNRKNMVEVNRAYVKNNRDKDNAKVAKRRALKLQRTPKWLKDYHIKETLEYYSMAKELEKVFPWKQHVDHKVPLQGKLVCGFHVPWNLQILSHKENLKKGNKHVDEESTSRLPEGYYKEGRVYTQFGLVPASRSGEDDNDTHHHCGADARQDADHRAQESSGDGMAQRNTEVEPSQTLTRLEDNGESEPEIIRLYFGSGYLPD